MASNESAEAPAPVQSYRESRIRIDREIIRAPTNHNLVASAALQSSGSRHQRGQHEAVGVLWSALAAITEKVNVVVVQLWLV